ncbi:sensor histidine kinase [Streptomyces hebeiensis]|uniref:histidine kinase n=2 Tax=Streptomyces hebeiensis TaxID=229486 RepID=A0ABP4FWD1_9ACTN
MDEAGRAVVRGAMGRVHKMHLALQDQLRELRDDFPDADPALMGRLLRIEMYNEQLGRAAQAPGIACGSPPMMFRDQHHLVDVVVSAASRVKDFERRIDEPANHLVRRIGVAAKAVEPLRCILSELLANAVECSHGTLKVGVELHETQAGATIFVDDAGVGLNAEQLTRAEQLIGSRRPARLTDLGDPPKHGWAAVGEMVRQFGFLVTVKQGPYGGARAIVTVPMGLLVEMPADVEQSVHAPQPVRMDPSGAVHTMAHEVVAGPDPNRPQPPGAVSQLPRRRRRAARTGPAAAPAVSRGSQEARTPEVAARRWGAWQTGRNEGNAAVDRGHEDPTERT